MGKARISRWQDVLALWSRQETTPLFEKKNKNKPSPNDELIKQTYTPEEIASVFRTLDEIGEDERI